MVALKIILGIIGGLGLFFFGFHITGRSLQNIASLSIKKGIEKLTKNVFMSTVVGFFITALVQSSSATTVFLVNFINAGLISLMNSMGIIFGANVGTTITVQFISLNLDQYVFPAIGLGAFLKLFSKKRSLNMSGDIILGFGLIFLGIVVMKNSVVPLENSGMFQELLGHTSNGTLLGIILGVTISALTAALMHSSAATLAIVIALSSIGAFKDLRDIIPLILGAKIGTCITGFIASIRSNRDGKRVALAHFMFNLTETVLTLLLLSYVVDIIKLTSSDISRQIANAHTATSIMTAIICIPFAGIFVRIVRRIIPVKDDEDESRNLFDVRLLENPTIAIASVKHALLRMANIINRMLHLSCDGIINDKYQSSAFIYDLEKNIDQLQVYSFTFIMEVSKLELSGYQALVLNSYREMTNDFERIADHVENIVENTEYTRKVACCLDKSSVDLITKTKDYLTTQYELIYKTFMDDNPELATAIISSSKKDEKYMFKANTIKLNQRIKSGEISAEQGMLLVDIMYNMQRISYHMRRVLYSILRIHQKYDDSEYSDLDDQI